MRLPPVATSGTTGSRWARAWAYAASSRSPVRSPSEPPRKPNSKEISTARVPSTLPVPQTTDSVSPVRSAARARAAS
jgi:hypothetical protein